MTFLYSFLSAVFGSLAAIFPISLGGHAVFWEKVNTTLKGSGFFSLGNDIIFVVYLAVFAALLIFCYEKIAAILKEIKHKTYIQNGSDTKEMLISLAFYVPSVLYIALFENESFPTVLLSVFLCLNVIVDFACDYVEKPRLNEKNRVYIMGISLMLGSLTGLSEISSVFLAGLLLGKKPAQSIRFSIVLYVPVVLIKAIICLVKACIGGFTLNFGYYILIFAVAFVTAFFAAGVMRKAAVKRNFRLFAYYTAIFAVIVIYTFMKG